MDQIIKESQNSERSISLGPLKMPQINSYRSNQMGEFEQNVFARCEEKVALESYQNADLNALKREPEILN